MPLDRDADQALAMEHVTPMLPGLYSVLQSAVAFYMGPDYSEIARAEHTDRAMANNIYAHAEKGLIRQFDGFAGISIRNARGLRVANYKDLVLVRLKKVAPNGKHRNYQTAQQRDYDDQKPIPGLPDPAVRLTAGYQLDASGTSIERVMIARPIGQSILWTAQVNVVDDVASWEDITPARFAGTGTVDFDAELVRRRRRGG